MKQSCRQVGTKENENLIPPNPPLLKGGRGDFQRERDNLLELIIAGFGGQGILFVGKLLCYAAMLEGKETTWFPSYGAEVRGGTANCTVIISDEMIGSPVVNNPDTLLIMNEASMKKFEPKLKAGGLLIMNESLIRNFSRRPDIEVVGIKANEIAEKLGNNQVANMVMLGRLIGKTSVISFDRVLTALREIVPPHRKNTIPINETALNMGLKEISD